MSVMRITEDQLAAVFKRRPFVQVQDVENGSAVLTKSNNPMALYIMHITKLEDKNIIFTKNKAKLYGNRAADKPALTAMKAWMVLGTDNTGRIACFFVSDPNMWTGLIKQHRVRKGLREGEIALFWPVSGGDHVFQGATVLTASNSTVVRAMADYVDDIDVWKWLGGEAQQTEHANVERNVDLQLEDWQLCVLQSVRAFIISNDISAWQNCGGQNCGGRHRTGKPERNWVCKVCAVSTQLYTGYEYLIQIMRAGMEPLMAVVCGHVAMMMINTDWPTFESIDFPTFETCAHEIFTDEGLLVDITAWCKIGKLGETTESDRWAYGEAILHVIDIRASSVGGSETRKLLPVWNFKGRTELDVPFTPIAANLLGGMGNMPEQADQVPKPKPTPHLLPKQFTPGWPVPQGIRNAGDTCATSTILQMVLCIPHLTDCATASGAQPPELCRIIQKLYIRGIEATLTELAHLHTIVQRMCTDPSEHRSADATEMLSQIISANPSMMTSATAVPVPPPACGAVLPTVFVFPGTVMPLMSPADSAEHTTVDILIADRFQDGFSYPCAACGLDHQSDISEVAWPKHLLVQIDRRHWDDVKKCSFTSHAVVTVSRFITVHNIIYETKALGLYDKEHWTSTVACRTNDSFYFCDDSTVVRHLSAQGIMRWPVALPTVTLLLLERSDEELYSSESDGDYIPSDTESDDTDTISLLPSEDRPVHLAEIAHPKHKRHNEYRASAIEVSDSEDEEDEDWDYEDEEAEEETEEEEEDEEEEEEEQEEEIGGDQDDNSDDDQDNNTHAETSSDQDTQPAPKRVRRAAVPQKPKHGGAKGGVGGAEGDGESRADSCASAVSIRVPDLDDMDADDGDTHCSVIKFARTPSVAESVSCSQRIWLNVPYIIKDKIKEITKQAGGFISWDPECKKWWVDKDSTAEVMKIVQEYLVQTESSVPIQTQPSVDSNPPAQQGDDVLAQPDNIQKKEEDIAKKEEDVKPNTPNIYRPWTQDS